MMLRATIFDLFPSRIILHSSIIYVIFLIISALSLALSEKGANLIISPLSVFEVSWGICLSVASTAKSTVLVGEIEILIGLYQEISLFSAVGRHVSLSFDICSS